MPAEVRIRVDGVEVTVPAGCSVAAALCHAGRSATRQALDGRPRAACCGMGVCFECRVRIDGIERLGCLARVADGMEIACDA
jgi:sarcosine oxidase subunit alpha